MRQAIYVGLAFAVAAVVWALSGTSEAPADAGGGASANYERELEAASSETHPPHLARAFARDGFAPLPKPRAGDWLAVHDEPGQSYLEFLRSRPLKPGAEGRKFIVLQPLGDFPAEAPSMEVLTRYLGAFFHPMEVRLADPIEVDESTIGHRTPWHAKEKQWNATDLLAMLKDDFPRDAYVVIAVTMTDLYPSKDWNFVFGLARMDQRVGVFSFARYDVKGDPRLALERALKVVSHETGHAFGVHHCTDHHCLMNGSNSLDETDRGDLQLCPVCLRKLHWGLQFDPSERYRNIESVLRSEGLNTQAEWFSARAELTKTPAE